MYFRVIFVTKSMTEGKPLKLILQFAVPLLFGNLLQQMYNLVDAAIVGRVLGTGALAAVGATSSVQFLVLGFCIGICIGFGIPIAKSFGAERLDKMRSYNFQLRAAYRLIRGAHHGGMFSVLHAHFTNALRAAGCF